MQAGVQIDVIIDLDRLEIAASGFNGWVKFCTKNWLKLAVFLHSVC